MMSGVSLSGRRVAVIGGGSGVGFAVAAQARAQGAEVIIASTNPEKIATAAARLPGVRGDKVDVRNETSVEAFFSRLGHFDHLAVTAGDWGGSMFMPTAELDLRAARDRMEVRFWGALMAAKYAARTIRPSGSITLTSGMLAHRPQKGGVLAAANGGAIEYMARALAVDLAPVRVNTVCLGLILTEVVARMSEEMRLAYTARLPVPRAGTPEEAATAYIHAMLNGYVTGQVLSVDGGGGAV